MHPTTRFSGSTLRRLLGAAAIVLAFCVTAWSSSGPAPATALGPHWDPNGVAMALGPHWDPNGFAVALGPHWDPNGFAMVLGPHWDPNGVILPLEPREASRDTGRVVA